MKNFIFLLALSCCFPSAQAEDSVVLGQALSNEPLRGVENPCPENALCMSSWTTWVIDVERVLSGPALSGRIATVHYRHGLFTPAGLKKFKLFVLRPIEDPEKRRLMGADYVMSGPTRDDGRFCLDHKPSTLEFDAATYAPTESEPGVYCFNVRPNTSGALALPE